MVVIQIMIMATLEEIGERQESGQVQKDIWMVGFRGLEGWIALLTVGKMRKRKNLQGRRLDFGWAVE